MVTPACRARSSSDATAGTNCSGISARARRNVLDDVEDEQCRRRGINQHRDRVRGDGICSATKALLMNPPNPRCLVGLQFQCCDYRIIDHLNTVSPSLPHTIATPVTAPPGRRCSQGVKRSEHIRSGLAHVSGRCGGHARRSRSCCLSCGTQGAPPFCPLSPAEAG